MERHKLNNLQIDMRELAVAFKDVREGLDLIEHIIFKSVLEEYDNGDNVDKRVDGVG